MQSNILAAGTPAVVLIQPRQQIYDLRFIADSSMHKQASHFKLFYMWTWWKRMIKKNKKIRLHVLVRTKVSILSWWAMSSIVELTNPSIIVQDTDTEDTDTSL